MTMSFKIRAGIVGACGRGAHFRHGCEAAGMRIVAACDINEAALGESAAALGAERRHSDYEAMLEAGNLDAVIIATPMPCHVPQLQMLWPESRLSAPPVVPPSGYRVRQYRDGTGPRGPDDSPSPARECDTRRRDPRPR
ncbi:MAG: Gfo/Idh/MocA family oxidoreductase [Candidatus Sumerlaeota bacterium]|nr:Gfo/Idh/MocA family oxidoreductase [Candidatus Sumerlaeota bacterium]